MRNMLPSIHLTSTIFFTLFANLTSAQQLFAAHSDGNVSTLALIGSGNTSTLLVTSVTSECEVNPASLNLDFDERILYCLDRGSASSAQGSLNSFSIGSDGRLARIARVSAPLSGVTAEMFEVPDTGVRGYVSGS